MMKKFLSYALPSALAMFISSLYTVIDGIFVGQGVGDPPNHYVIWYGNHVRRRRRSTYF